MFFKKRIKKELNEALNHNIINEKITQINVDVDFIYNKYFKESVDKISETGTIDRINVPNHSLSTEFLTSEYAIKAHKLNPCTIVCSKETSNYYNPSENIISLSFNRSAYNFVKSTGGDIEYAANELNNKQAKTLVNEFREERIKGSINHELVHWIDDSLNNRHISKHISQAKETNSTNPDANGHSMEIQAQIHNIVQLKRKYNRIWDRFSFEELMNLTVSLKTVHDGFKTLEKRNKWLKTLKKRMHREGLLGKNMYN